LTGYTVPGERSHRESPNSVNTKLHCGSFARTIIRTVIGAGAAASLLFFSAGSAWAVGEVVTGGPDPNGGYHVHVTGANSPNERCNFSLDPDPEQGGKDAVTGIVDWPQIPASGHDSITVHCQHPVRDAQGNFTGAWADDSIQTITIATGKVRDMTPGQPAQPPSAAPAPPPAAAPADPLGTTWGFSDSGGAATPWTGTWTRQAPGSTTWNWTESNSGLPGNPSASGTADITWDGTTVHIKRHLNGGSQTCDYVGTPTGSSITGLFTGFKGTVNCSNSGIANMEWHTTSIK
jgi:hypothetical protein